MMTKGDLAKVSRKYVPFGGQKWCGGNEVLCVVTSGPFSEFQKGYIGECVIRRVTMTLVPVRGEGIRLFEIAEQRLVS